MPRDADIVVVGAGIMGAATARELARAGRRVLVLEQFTPGHARGSSHGTTRIFRLSYDDERYVRLARASLDGWRELEAEVGSELLVQVGALDLGGLALDIGRTLGSCGVAYDVLSGSQMRRRWGIRCADDEPGVFQSDGGVLRAEEALRALLDVAQAQGVELQTTSRVVALERARGALSIGTEDGVRIECNAAVIAAGAWATRLLRSLDVELAVVPTRETVAHVELESSDTPLPTVIDYSPLSPAHVGTLERTGEAWFALALPGDDLKIGLHHAGPVTDPDTDPDPDPGIAAAAFGWAKDRFDGIGDPVGAETCIYTNTADQGFVLERHGRVVVASACSGHGFKFAPHLGRTVAALAIEASRG